MLLLKKTLMGLFLGLMISSQAFAFQFNGFSDITVVNSEDGRKAENTPIGIGQVDFYAAHNIDDDLDVLVELVVESNEDGEWVIDLERLQVGNYFNDYLKISAGRFHNVLGYWNATYHHASLLHTTISRPTFLEFEDEHGVIPTHLVGFWGHGWMESGLGSFTYDAMLGNGSKLVGAKGSAALDPNNTSDDNDSKAWTLNVQYEPANIFGSGVGVFAHGATTNSNFTKDTQGNVGTNIEVDQLIYGTDLFIYYDDLEVLGEVYLIDSEDAIGSAGSNTSTGAFLQASYGFGKFKPYARYEMFSSDDNDIYVNALGFKDYTTTILGVNYDIRSRSSLKGEIRLNEVDSDNVGGTDDSYTELAFQWAFLF